MPDIGREQSSGLGQLRLYCDHPQIFRMIQRVGSFMNDCANQERGCRQSASPLVHDLLGTPKPHRA